MRSVSERWTGAGRHPGGVTWKKHDGPNDGCLLGMLVSGGWAGSDCTSLNDRLLAFRGFLKSQAEGLTGHEI